MAEKKTNSQTLGNSGGIRLKKMGEPQNGTSKTEGVRLTKKPEGGLRLGVTSAEMERARGRIGAPRVGERQIPESDDYNNGGLVGGVGYALEKVGLGLISSFEGAADFVGAGLNSLIGNDERAKEILENDWVNYAHADDWFNPSKGWQTVGDVAQGVGYSLPAIAIQTGLAFGTAGLSLPAQLAISGGATFVGSMVPAAGNAVKEAYQKTGNLGRREWGYGIAAGAMEGAIETFTDGIIGGGVGSIGRLIAGNAGKTAVKAGLIKTTVKSFASEAVEEAISAYLTPKLARATYDPEAKDATFGEIMYSSFVGGLAGAVMGGGGYAVDSVRNLSRGARLSAEGKEQSVMEGLRDFAEYEERNASGIEAFAAAKEALAKYEKMTSGTGGKAMTAAQKAQLGYCEAVLGVAGMQAPILDTAGSILHDPEKAAAMINAMYKDSKTGQSVGVTAEALTEGIVFSEDNRTYMHSLQNAMKTNDTLRNTVVLMTAGRLSLDPEAYAQTVLGRGEGQSAADREMLAKIMTENRAKFFGSASTASEEQKNAVRQALGMENDLDYSDEEFGRMMYDYLGAEDGARAIEQSRAMRKMEVLAKDGGRLPAAMTSAVADGVYRYKTAEGGTVVIAKDGDKYSVSERGYMRRDLSLGRVNDMIRDYNKRSKARAEQKKKVEKQTERKDISEARTDESAEKEEPKKRVRREARTVDGMKFAEENVPEFKELSHDRKSAVAYTIERAAHNGATDSEIKALARVSLKSGLRIEFDAKVTKGANGVLKGNTIYLSPELDEGKTYHAVLLHEMVHHIFRKGGGTKLIADAFMHVDGALAQKIVDKYKKYYEAKGMKRDDYLPIIDEEVAAAYGERVLESEKAWEYILSVEPQKAESVLGFFKQAALKYAGLRGLSYEARAFLKEYDKMFRAVTERGEGRKAKLLGRKEVEKKEIVGSAAPITLGRSMREGFAVEIDGARYSLKSMKNDIAEGRMLDDLIAAGIMDEAEVKEFKANLERLMDIITPKREFLDLNEGNGREDRPFAVFKQNSDPLYKMSLDFSTLCRKRLMAQYIIEKLQLRKNAPLSAEEQMAIRDMIIEYRETEKALQVACAMCYVEAARLKAPKQIERWLADPEVFMTKYFAKKNKAFNDSVREKQKQFKLDHGYKEGTAASKMKPKDKSAFDKMSSKMRESYQVTEDERQIIEKAKHLPNSTYLTAENLAGLAENEPVIYDSYSSHIRSATRSKPLEKDVAYYYGDSASVSDAFIESVNAENGMRFQSWSDWQIKHLLDMITAVTDLAVRRCKMHGYTKFPQMVRIFGKTGMLFNLSGVAGTSTGFNEDGSLSFSETESIDYNEAMKLREEFPETAGMQCIAVSDDHVRALLDSDVIDYVIPYHASGLNASLKAMAGIYGWVDYTQQQEEKEIAGRKDSGKPKWHEKPTFGEFFRDSGETGVESMRQSAQRYLKLCEERGLTPKFEKFKEHPNYWKLLIDRKMINQKTGKLIEQKAVRPIFDFDLIAREIDSEVFDPTLADRALSFITEHYDELPERIKKLKRDGKAKKQAKTVANAMLTAVTDERFDLSDAEYMEAVGRGDTETERDIVLKAARHRGYDSPILYHGTEQFGFTRVDPKGRGGQSFFLADDAKVADGYAGTHTGEPRQIGDRRQNGKKKKGLFGARAERGIYAMVGKTEGQFSIDCGGSRYDSIRLKPGVARRLGFEVGSTDQIAMALRELGVKSVRFHNVIDEGVYGSGMKACDVYAYFDGALVKSVDPVTYDDDGDVILPSQRFGDTEEARYDLAESDETDFLFAEAEKRGKAVESDPKVLDAVAKEKPKVRARKSEARMRADAVFKAERTKLVARETERRKKAEAKATSTKAIADIREQVLKVKEEITKQYTVGRLADPKWDAAVQSVPRIIYRGTLRVAQARDTARLYVDFLRSALPSFVAISDAVLEGGDVDKAIVEYQRVKHDPQNPDEFAMFLDTSDAVFVARLIEIGNGSDGDAFDDQGLTDVRDCIKEILRLSRKVDKVFLDGKWADVHPLAQQCLDEMASYRGLQKADPVTERSFRKFFGDVAKSTMQPDDLIGMLEGRVCIDESGKVRERDGILLRSYQEMVMAKERQMAKEADYRKPFEDYRKEHRAWEKGLRKRELTFTLHGKEIVLTPDEAMSLLMTAKDKDSMAALCYGRLVFSDNSGRKGQKWRNRRFMDVFGTTASSRIDKPMTDEEEATRRFEAESEENVKSALKALEEQLTEEDRGYMALLEAFYNGTSKNDKKAADERYIGKTNIKNGYYYPLRRSSEARDVNLIGGEFDFENMGVNSLSFNKQRIKGANAGLLISGATEVFRSHAKGLSIYVEMTDSLRAFQKIYNCRVENPKAGCGTPKDYLNTKAWNGMGGYMLKLFEDLQDRSVRKNDPIDILLGKIKSGYAVSTLGLNIGSAVKQLSTLIMMRTAVSGEAYGRGLAKARNKDRMDEFSVAARNRATGDDLVKAQGGSEMGRVLSDIGEKGMLLFTFGDRRVCQTMFSMCQHEVARTKGLALDTEANLKEAGKLLDKFILRFQDTSNVGTKSGLARSQNEIYVIFTMFRSAVNKMFSGAVKCANDYFVVKGLEKSGKDVPERLKASLRKRLAGFLAAVLGVSVFETVVGTLRQTLRGTKDDEEKKQHIWELVLNFLGTVPVAGQLFEDIFSEYDASMIYTDAVNNIRDLRESIVDIVEDTREDGVPSEKLARLGRSFSFTLGQFAGVPIRNLNHVINTSMRILAPEVAVRAKAAIYEPQIKDLKKAVAKGDEKRVGTILDLMMNKRTDEKVSESSFAELARLTSEGFTVYPRTVASKVTKNDVAYTLTKEQKKVVKKGISDAAVDIDTLIGMSGFGRLTDEQKETAIGYVYDDAYDNAIAKALGLPREGQTLVARSVGVAKAAIFKARTKGLESDKDGKGESIAGSKRKKVLAVVRTMGASQDEKLILFAFAGYTWKDGEMNGMTAIAVKERMKRYIRSRKDLTGAEKEALARKCGITLTS